MSDDYAKIATEDVELRERRGGGASSRDISGALETEQMKIRQWIYTPGHEMAYHRHQTQEEVYYLVSGGPQTVQVGEDDLELNDGDWIRLAKDTPRRIRNQSQSDAVWLTVAAPPGEGIMDGIRLTDDGEVIPRK
ncbi:MAG: cupin domain-containing protein [Thermoleophilia bacterium]|nr:cupin domain-containing protein [Thermoleophilia bacterium]